MKKNILEYKGYHAVIEFDSETFLLRGKIEGINDFVDFSSKDASQIEKEFREAVDDYLEFCEEVGKEPEKEYKGTFNVRIQPLLHKRLAEYASKNGESLNAIVEKAIQSYVTEVSTTTSELQQTIRILSDVISTQNIHYADNYIKAGNESMYISNSSFGLENVKMFYDEGEVLLHD